MISDLKHNINFNLIKYNKLSFHCRFLVVIVSIFFNSHSIQFLIAIQVISILYTSSNSYYTLYNRLYGGTLLSNVKYISILQSEWKFVFSKVCIFGYWHWNNEHDLYTKFLTTTNRSLKNIILVSTLHIAPRYINTCLYIDKEHNYGQWSVGCYRHC